MSSQTASVITRLKNYGLLRTKGLIGGKWTQAYDGRTMEVNNPATGEVIASVPCMGERETKDVISAANDAFSHWSRLTAADRSIRLRNWYNLLIAHKQELGQLITLEQGKPLKEAIEEVGYGASFIEFFAEDAKRVYGDIIPSPLRDCRLFVLKQMSSQTASVITRLRNCGLLRTKGLIGGKWTQAYDGRTMEVHNPATGEVIASVPCMGERETKDAISAANDAFSHWSRLTAADRSIRLRNWYNLLIAHKQELGQLITLEQGKPLKEAIEEVGYGASFIEFFAEEAKRVYGDIIPSPLRDCRLFVLKQPVGVVGAITPWNFPFAMITRKVVPALACGCSVVIKPSELTPLTALATAELAIQSGIPPGVLNVVMGDAPSIGNSLLESSQVRKITFTGSTAVGKKLMAGAAETVKRVSLELGGNAPCIIFDDADLEVAVKQTLITKFGNTGQECICTNRLLVQEGIYDKFVNAFSTAVRNIKVGNGFAEGVTQGPLINEAAVQKVESFVQDAISKGAKALVGGKRHSLGMTFYEPTILSDVKNDMLIARQEIFGPVAPIIRFKTEEEAIQIANDTNSGLVAYIFTNSIQRSWRLSEALEYGMVGVNEGWIFTEVAPFGGIKESGLGQEGSKYGLDDYLEIKYLCMGNMG